MPVEVEFLPRDHLAVRRVEPTLVVLNHVLYVQGYRLDAMSGHMHISKGHGYEILVSLWKCDQFYNRNQLYLRYEMTDKERRDPWFNSFLEVCRETSPSEDQSIPIRQAPCWNGQRDPTVAIS
jgi:hypothetical protein